MTDRPVATQYQPDNRYNNRIVGGGRSILVYSKLSVLLGGQQHTYELNN